MFVHQDNSQVVSNQTNITSLQTQQATNTTNITGVKTKTDLITITGPQNLNDHNQSIIDNAVAILAVKNNSVASTLKTAVDTNTAKTGISSAQTTKLGHITITSSQDLDVHGTQILVNSGNITTKTDQKINRCLERIGGICDGRQLHTQSGSTITLANITAAQDIGQSWSDVNGSEITYTPPTFGAFGGATRGVVVYKFSFHYAKHNTVGEVQGDNDNLGSFKFLIDDANNGSYTELTVGKQVIGASMFYGTQVDMEISLVVDSTLTKDVAKGIFDSWTSAKKIKVQVYEYSTGTEFNLHQPMYYQNFFLPNNGTTNVPILKPQISIETYGYG